MLWKKGRIVIAKETLYNSNKKIIRVKKNEQIQVWKDFEDGRVLMEGELGNFIASKDKFKEKSYK